MNLGIKKRRNKRKIQKPLKSPLKIPKKNKKDSDDASLSAIPDSVSQRMIKRMAIFSGIPTALGMSSFFIFYWVVTNDLLDIPNSVVGAISLGLFGLGVLGLSYGIFSASWDENQVGSLWGWQEFTQNLGRTVKAWRNAREEATKKN
ncbi:PAM68 family protein [Crocosphaera watsonii]|uniref:PAM68 family protein n=1 Tax=Crocosphaera watsonii TaxID=263511 RepID=UPI000AFF36D2|nr:PAM68 family protein [Crocosphaera watsonii]